MTLFYAFLGVLGVAVVALAGAAGYAVAPVAPRRATPYIPHHARAAAPELPSAPVPAATGPGAGLTDADGSAPAAAPHLLSPPEVLVPLPEVPWAVRVWGCTAAELAARLAAATPTWRELTVRLSVLCTLVAGSSLECGAAAELAAYTRPTVMS